MLRLMTDTAYREQRLWQPEVDRPRLGRVVVTVAVATAILAILFLLYALWGIHQIRRALIDETRRNGIALLESLSLAAQYSVATSVLTDRLEWDNLSARARLAGAVARQGTMTSDELSHLSEVSEADGITVWARDQVPVSYPEDLQAVLEEQTFSFEQAWEAGEFTLTPFRLADTVSQNEWTGAGFPTPWGAVIAWERLPLSESKPSWSGIGLLIQEIGRRSDIDYIMLQSPEGIVFASRSLPPVLRLAADTFLVNALDDTVTATREIVFDGVPVLEVVRPFLSTDLPSGMLRVGISLAGVETARRRLVFQLGLSAFLFFLLAVVALAFVVVRRSYSDLDRSYRRVETLTRRILDSIDQAVIATDLGGRLTVFNRAAETLLGQRVATDDKPPVGSVLGSQDYGLPMVAAGGEAIHEREYHLETGGATRHLVYSTTPVTTRAGQSEGAVTVVRDETQAREMAEEMERARRLSEMGDLAAGVAHEIRNPLNAIAMAAQRLRLELTDQEAVALASTVLEETQRLNAIVEDFLSLARSSPHLKAPLDFSQLVASVMSMAALEAQPGGVVIEGHVMEGIAVHGAAAELRKAIWNLFSNAIAATPRGGTIRVYLNPAADRVRFVVEDNGRGITKADLSRVFQPYFTTKDRGTGIGLTITHRIVTEHGGTIQVESPPPDSDKGTRVTIDLPGESSTHSESAQPNESRG